MGCPTSERRVECDRQVGHARVLDAKGHMYERIGHGSSVLNMQNDYLPSAAIGVQPPGPISGPGSARSAVSSSRRSNLRAPTKITTTAAAAAIPMTTPNLLSAPASVSPNAYAPSPNAPAHTMPPNALNRRKLFQLMQLMPASTAANARSTATKRPK